MTYRAVIFDLDGTLLDSLRDLADSMNQSLMAYGLPQHPVDAYRFFVGDGIETLVLRAAPESKDNPELKRRILLSMRKEYKSRWANNTRPYAGIAELLDALTKRGVKMAVYSNKPHDFTELCVTRLLPEWRFGLIYGVSEQNPRKPDPTVPLRIAKRFEIEPKHFLYLGDTGMDMKTALASGMVPIGALWGFRSKEELLAGGTKTVIDHPMHLMKLIE
ncbi:MAG: HAD family hydrolase [Deltaproteobacteria bacterium]|nr:HAD family hydrolase [Deltaproteobacteria bacterium]